MRFPHPLRTSVLAAGALLSAACAGDAPRTADLTFPARDSGQVTAEPACADCTIVFDTVVTLGADDDPGGLSDGASVVWDVDSRGRYYVPVGGGEVFIYGPDAAFQRTLAPIGLGPGELPNGRSHVSVGPGDTVRVVSQYPRPGRIHVFGPDLAFVRSAALDPSIAGPIFVTAPNSRGRPSRSKELPCAGERRQTASGTPS